MELDYSKKYDYENGFYLTSDITRIGKMLAHYELYKKIRRISGAIVECGVYKGASLTRFATFRECLESQYSRKIVGFDMFGQFPRVENKEDNEFIDMFEGQGGNGIDVNSLNEIFKKKGFSNYELIKGDLTETIDEYLRQNPAFRIAMLHVDVDVYKPTKYVLEKLYERVVPGGIIVLDDYGMVKGGTEAVDDFINENNLSVVIEKIPYYQVPAYIRK